MSTTQSLKDQTVRMIIAPHLGGGTLRLHFSNRYGAAPVTLGPITVALSGAGPSLVAGSERPVKFGGRRALVIPAGGDAVSDPVRVSFAPFRALTVSVYVPGAVTRPVEHLVDRQSNYLTAPRGGDASAQSSGAAFTEKTTGLYSSGWYFLDGVDVLAPGSNGAVVAFGDSLTDGYQAKSTGIEQLSTIDTNTRYPDDLARRLIAARIPLSVLDAGISGDQLLRSGLPTFGPGGLARFGPDVLAQAGVSDVIVLEGVNDIAQKATAASLIAAYEQLITRAHGAGVAIQLGTLTPTAGAVSAAYASAAATSVREQVNQWIRAEHFSDGIVDFDAAVRDPREPQAITPADQGGDHLHFSPAGNEALARAVDIAALARPSCVVAAQRP
ncbi:MAG TPA: GDSL-type esterase/lipase family protein [Solirubrobacteraceae bacterium]|nr:GDSL-type esterase/lipase family protein [Solirubrobacteraceae bacterium]